MYLKLADRIIRTQIEGLHFVGCPRKSILYALNDHSFDLVETFLKGHEIDLESLPQDDQNLLNELLSEDFFKETLDAQHPARTAYLHITSLCNMNCIGCYSERDNRNKTGDLSLSDMKVVIDNLSKANVKTIIISGGEPFLRKDLIEIIQYIKQKEIRISCITNGLASIREYEAAMPYLDDLSFSLDGFSEESSTLRANAFADSNAKIKELSAKGLQIAIIFTLHKKNYTSYLNMVQLAKRYNIPYNFSLFTAIPNDGNNEYQFSDIDLLKLYEISDNDLAIADTPLSKSLSCSSCCGAGRTLVSVSSRGDVFPCHLMNEAEFKMGNALKDDINKLIIKTPKDGYYSVDRKEDCKGCDHAYLCGGGCLYRSYALYGDLNKKDQLCDLFKLSVARTIHKLMMA